MSSQIQSQSRWATRRAEKHRRLARVASIADGVVLPTDRIVDVLQNLIAPGDRVVVEGNNQKQADFLSRSLAEVDPASVHDLHLIIPGVEPRRTPGPVRARHRQQARLSPSPAPQSLRIAQFLEDGMLEIGAIHTYIELYARLYVDLTPNVALVARLQGRPRRAISTPAPTPRTRPRSSKPRRSATAS